MSSSQMENTCVKQSSNVVNGKAKKHKIKISSSVPVERRTLQTLQLSAEDGCLTRHSEHKLQDGKDKTKSKILDANKPLLIFEDPAQEVVDNSSKEGKAASVTQSTADNVECACQCHQKTEEQQMYDFMTAEPSLQEWKELAEKRREALDESLIENQQLHFEISEFKAQVSNLTDELQDKEEEIKHVRQQRDEFANFLEKLVDDNNEDSCPSDSPDSAVSESAFVSDSS